MSKPYILPGPADAGNQFGYFKRGIVPAGAFAVVEDGEYANGGYGPSLEGRGVFGTREEAEAEIIRLSAGVET